MIALKEKHFTSQPHNPHCNNKQTTPTIIIFQPYCLDPQNFNHSSLSPQALSARIVSGTLLPLKMNSFLGSHKFQQTAMNRTAQTFFEILLLLKIPHADSHISCTEVGTGTRAEGCSIAIPHLVAIIAQTRLAYAQWHIKCTVVSTAPKLQMTHSIWQCIPFLCNTSLARIFSRINKKVKTLPLTAPFLPKFH